MGWGLWEFSDSHFRWSGGQQRVPVENNIYSDGAAYYAYLPKWFYADQDDFSFLDHVMEKYPNSRFDDNLHKQSNSNHRKNKYYTGTAVLMTPFFLTAHIIQSASGNSVDGYASSYLLMASVAAIFYWLLGALAIYLLLRRMKIPIVYILLSIAIITFGTNLFHYVVYAPTYAHVYSFACSSWLLYISKRWVESNRNVHLLLLGFLIGLGFIVRPTNVIILLFLPFFFNSTKEFLQRGKTMLTAHRLSLILFLCILSLPLIFHFLNIGALNSYTNEGFDNLYNPFVFEVLFGVRRGIFFYAPALLISIAGLIILFGKKRSYFWGFLIVFAVFTYLISSWWCWWYGGSFSMRPFVDVLPIFAIPLAFLLYRIHKFLKVLVILLLLVSTSLTQLYSYQFIHNILHYDGMEWEEFNTVFLQTDERFEWYPYLKFDELPKSFQKKVEVHPFKYHTDFAPNKYSLTLPVEENKRMFAGKITGSFKIESAFGKPMFKLMYFKNDSILKDTEFLFGAKIPNVNEYARVSLDVYPELRCNEFDSIGIILFDGATGLSAEELVLEIYSK